MRKDEVALNFFYRQVRLYECNMWCNISVSWLCAVHVWECEAIQQWCAVMTRTPCMSVSNVCAAIASDPCRAQNKLAQSTLRPRFSGPLLSGSLAMTGCRFTAFVMHTHSMCVRLSGSLVYPDIFWKTDVCG